MKIQHVLGETLGTFILVLVGCGSTVLIKKCMGSIDMTSTFSLTLMLLVYTIGTISKYHINPAETIALAFIRKLSVLEATWCIAAQLLGYVLGGLALTTLHHASGSEINQMIMLVLTSISAHLLIFLSSNEAFKAKR